jgi:hypothetical protein
MDTFGTNNYVGPGSLTGSKEEDPNPGQRHSHGSGRSLSAGKYREIFRLTWSWILSTEFFSPGNDFSVETEK